MLPRLKRMEGRKGGGRKGINWLAVRTYYVTNPEATHEECSKRFGVSVRSVESHASKEGWAEQRSGQLREADKQLRDANAGKIAENRVLHCKVTGGALRILEKIITEIERNGFVKADGTAVESSMSKIEMASALSVAVHRASEADRLNLGIKPGESSTAEQDDEPGIAIEQRRLEPKQIDVDPEGRAV